MRKLPVWTTYRHVVGFALGRFLTVLRLTWLPIGALLAAAAVFVVFQFSMMVEMMPNAPGRSMRAELNPWLRHFDIMVASQVAVLLLQLIAMAAAAVAVHRTILFGDTKSGVVFNFPFAAAEARYFTMCLLYIVLMIAILAAVMVPVLVIVTGGDLAVVFAQGPAHESGLPPWLAGWRVGLFSAAYMIGWLAVLVVFVRLTVWPASVVATGRLSPAEAWSLTRGNAWRLVGLFALSVLTMYAFMIPFLIAWVVYMKTNFVDAGVKPPATPQALLEQVFLPLAPFIAAFYFLFLVFLIGLMTAAVSYAYKALKGYDAQSPIPESGASLHAY